MRYRIHWQGMASGLSHQSLRMMGEQELMCLVGPGAGRGWGRSGQGGGGRRGLAGGGWRRPCGGGTEGLVVEMGRAVCWEMESSMHSGDAWGHVEGTGGRWRVQD